MIVFRFILLVFNVAVVTFLIYQMIVAYRQPMKQSKKVMIIVGGTMLLLAPFGMFLNFFYPTAQYFIIYPVAIGLFLYLVKRL